MTLRGTALIDNVLASQLLAAASDPSIPAGVRGRVNLLPDGRIGRFGWKAQTATLVEFMGEAFRDEIGVTNPLAPDDLVNGCGANILKPEMDAVPLTALVAFLNVHLSLRGGDEPRWSEIIAVFERDGLFGVLQWLGLPASIWKRRARWRPKRLPSCSAHRSIARS